jgi:DNA polymerase
LIEEGRRIFRGPFVGAAGKFLDQLLAEAGLSRSRIYITNVVKCFLPENRATEDQVKSCHSIPRSAD